MSPACHMFFLSVTGGEPVTFLNAKKKTDTTLQKNVAQHTLIYVGNDHESSMYLDDRLTQYKRVSVLVPSLCLLTGVTVLIRRPQAINHMGTVLVRTISVCATTTELFQVQGTTQHVLDVYNSD